MTSIYPNLSAEMSRYGISDSDVAFAVSKDPRTVRNWISGKTDIPYRQCMQIRDALFAGMSTDYLFSTKPVDVCISAGA